MNQAPDVCLLMAVYRPRLDWLGAAVESALRQQGVRAELLLVDDGNEPPLEDLLRGVDDPRLRIVRLEHGGVAKARNVGVASTQARYLRLLDADDVFPPRSTARLVELMQGRDDLITYGASMLCDAELRPLWKMSTGQQGDARIASLFTRFHVRPGGVLCPRWLLEREPFDPSYRVSGDWEQMQRALEHVQVRGTRQTLHLYRRHGSGITARIEDGRDSARRIVEAYLERHPEQRSTRLERDALAMLDATSARVYASHHQPGKALRYLARGLRRDPLCLRHDLSQAGHLLTGRLARVLRPRSYAE
ncbi:MAG TPA: glycosyltransferase family 2 protein [Solirubrobacteraceae bacterium]|jgi:glycosyltransferase involved in cell wall biosynthesis